MEEEKKRFITPIEDSETLVVILRYGNRADPLLNRKGFSVRAFVEVAGIEKGTKCTRVANFRALITAVDFDINPGLPKAHVHVDADPFAIHRNMSTRFPCNMGIQFDKTLDVPKLVIPYRISHEPSSTYELRVIVPPTAWEYDPPHRITPPLLVEDTSASAIVLTREVAWVQRPTTAERVYAYFSHFEDNERAPKLLSMALRRSKGKDEELLSKMESKYGPESCVKPASNKPPVLQQFIAEELKQNQQGKTQDPSTTVSSSSTGSSSSGPHSASRMVTKDASSSSSIPLSVGDDDAAPANFTLDCVLDRYGAVDGTFTNEKLRFCIENPTLISLREQLYEVITQHHATGAPKGEADANAGSPGHANERKREDSDGSDNEVPTVAAAAGNGMAAVRAVSPGWQHHHADDDTSKEHDADIESLLVEYWNAKKHVWVPLHLPRVFRSMLSSHVPSNVPVKLRSAFDRCNIQHWEPLKRLGRGSFGEVWQAVDKDTGAFLAVKYLTCLSATDRHAIQIEVSMMRQLLHPNLVRYYGAVIGDDVVNIFMEYIPGGTLSDLARMTPMSIRQVQIYTEQVLQGIAFLHSFSIVHRDIKGANVMIGADGKVKITDFGTARHLGSTASATHTVTGTPFFMAPEVMQNEATTMVADIWSLGCLVIELLTGEMPQYGADDDDDDPMEFINPLQLMFYVVTKKCGPRIPRDIPAEAKDFLRKCLVFEAEKRPTAQQLLAHPFVKKLAPVA